MTRLPPLLAVLLIACPSAGDPSDEPPVTLPAPDAVVLDGPCPLAERYGHFAIEDYAAYTVVQGQVADGVVPVSILEEVYSDDRCSLLKRNNPFCDPGCASNEACDFDGTCVPFPAAQDLGTVRADGLLQTVTMEPAMPGYNYFSTSLPHPATTPGSTVRIRSGEGTWAPFELWGVGVDPLVMAEDVTWTVQEGADIDVEWTAPSGTPWGEIAFELTIDQHGTSPASLHCAFDDTGSATVPAASVNALLDAGVSGWPSATLTRRTVDSAPVGAGCAELVVASPRPGEVRLADYTPCDASTPCPQPMQCDLARGLCQ